MNKTLITAMRVLAVALLVCLLPMPYGYYVLVRFATMIVMVCLAYSFYGANKTGLAVAAGSLALLFQPFVKVSLGRGMWNIVDVVVAVGLLLLSWKCHSNKNDNL